MTYYPEPDSHIRDKAKVVLNLLNYFTKTIKCATGFDTFDLMAKKDFIALKAEVHQLDINKLVTLHKKWSFPLSISSVNVTKSAGSLKSFPIYWLEKTNWCHE